MPLPTAIQATADDLLLAHEIQLRGYLLAVVRSRHDVDDLYQE